MLTGDGTQARRPQGAVWWWALGPASISCAMWMVFGPITGDEHAARFRAWLASESIVPVWNMRWMSGHHLPGYGVIMPLLARPFGVRFAAVLAVAIAVYCVGGFVENAPRRPLVAGLLSVGLTANVWSGRLTFVTGVAFGALALRIMIRGGRRASPLRVSLLAVVAILATLTSPLVGVFLAMYGASRSVEMIAVDGGAKRTTIAPLLTVITIPCVVIGATAVLFPEGGSLPFAASAWLGIMVACAVVIVLAWRAACHNVVAICAMFAAAASLLWFFDSPIGANIGRPVVLLAPAAVAALWPAKPGKESGRRRTQMAMAMAVGGSLMWQWSWPISDVIKASGDRSNSRAYFAPVVAAIEAQGVVKGGGRVEVVPLRSKADAEWMGEKFAIARGWDRQLDLRDNAELYAATITADRYRAWLTDHAVAFVALPNAALDEGGHAESKLLATPPAYLREIPSGHNWHLYAVVDAAPIVRVAGGVETSTGGVSIGIDSITFVVPTLDAAVVVRINDSRWLHVEGDTACITRRSAHAVELRVKRPGQIVMSVGVGFAADC